MHTSAYIKSKLRSKSYIEFSCKHSWSLRAASNPVVFMCVTLSTLVLHQQKGIPSNQWTKKKTQVVLLHPKPVSPVRAVRTAPSWNSERRDRLGVILIKWQVPVMPSAPSSSAHRALVSVCARVWKKAQGTSHSIAPTSGKVTSSDCRGWNEGRFKKKKKKSKSFAHFSHPHKSSSCCTWSRFKRCAPFLQMVRE